MKPIETLLSFPATVSITDIISGDTWHGDQIEASVAQRHDELLDMGVGRGDFVLIGYGGKPSFFADLYSVWRAGAAAICIGPSLTAGEIERVNEFTSPKVAIFDDGKDGGVEGISQCISPASVCDGPTISPPVTSISPDDLALVLFTSGTTSDPKGVVLSHGALFNRITLNLEHIPAGNLRNTLCVMPTHFGHGLIGNCLTALMGGGNLCLMGGNILQGINILADVIEKHGITFMSSTPSFWRMALRSRSPVIPSPLKQVSIGSEPVTSQLVEAVSKWSGTDDIRVMYGITECANWVSGYSKMGHDPEDGYVGRMWGGRAGVRDADGQVSGHGEGEIVLQTPSLMSGYMHRDDLSGDAISDGWYATGDSGRVTNKGDIYITGRIKQEINRAGVKISPNEVEALLEKHEDVDEVCAFPLPDLTAGEIVGVALKLAEGVELDILALRGWCAERIRCECVPDRWFVVDSIPRTERGKIDRKTIRTNCLKEF